jgi:Flp pilus assembly protein TadD
LLILPFLSMLSQPVAAQTTDSATSIAAAITHLREREYDKAARILEAITTREPGNARAWALLGSVFQSAGELDRALVAHLKAVKFDQTAPNAMYNAGVVFALKGDKHQAFEWLGKAKASGRVDVTQIGIDPDAETLRDDPRYKQLFPTPAEFEDPFVEDVEIIQAGMWMGTT